MNSSRSRRALALASIVVAALATVATSPPRSQLNANAESEFSLTPDQPVTSRLVRVELEHGGAQFSSAELMVYADSGGGETETWISIHASDAAAALLNPTLGSAQSVSLARECSAGCSVAFLVVARLNSSAIAVGDSGRIRASVGVTYVGGSASPPPGARASVAFEASDAVESPAHARAEALGRLEIGTNSASATWNGTLVVPAAALASGGGRMIGTLWLTGNAGEDLMDIAHDGVLTVGSASRQFAVWGGPLYSTGVEWLSQCTPGADCRVPVSVAISLDPESDEPSTLDFRLDARLEYLDMASPPSNTRLELVPD